MPPGRYIFQKGGDYYGTKIISVFPNAPQYFVKMVLNNLQKPTRGL